MRRIVLTGLVAAALVLGAVPASAVAAGPPNSGPPLSVSSNWLDQNLHCTGGAPDKATVLLLPGTTINTEENFGWNYVQAFLLDERPVCTLDLPNRTMGDIQVAAEYVVAAIRAVHHQSGHKIAIVGHSQGGMIGRWALKYWPDTRGMVDDLIGMAPSNHGTDMAELLCNPDCAPAIWQQRTSAAFIRALNTGPETWPGTSYTVIYSHDDGIIVPPEASKLTTGYGQIANVATSDACPGHNPDHLSLGTYDPVTYALVTDALNHPGPASLDRFDPAACTQFTQPGVNQEFFAVNGARAFAAVAGTMLFTPHVPSEPKLAPYAR
ncbi:MAG TPA: alpha/beta fold hydrolase [Sporichthya sp.]|nr:alpha/beta fold hydrolase [Sporichthya sp.]